MLTPRFGLSQDANFLTVKIYAPFTNIDQTEIFMDGSDFRFSSAPYFLRLHLPGEVEESETASGSWDAETTSFVIKCPKVKPGENFEGLDMLTQLLTPKGNTEINVGVEELTNEEDHDEEDEDIEWYFEQILDSPDIKLSRDSASYGYGFGFTQTQAYTKLLAELGEILDLEDPDSLSHGEREESRLAKETKDFSSDHYLCDLYQDEGVIECLEWKPVQCLTFTEEQQQQMLNLPRKQYLIARKDLSSVHLTLADILYGHCFALRIFQGESSTEHGWMAAKLSASLCACARFSTSSKMMTSCMRRALIYPFFRHWDLASNVWKDVIKIIEEGRIAVIKELLSLNDAFGETPGYYIYNQLYISPYCSWLQTVPDSHLLSLAKVLASSLENLKKMNMGLDLEELEEAAKLTLEEEDEDGLVNGMERISVRKVINDTGDDSDDSSDESDSSSEDGSDDDDDK